MSARVRNTALIIAALALAAAGTGLFWTQTTPSKDPEERARVELRKNPRDPARHVNLAELLLQRAGTVEASANTAPDPAAATAMRNQADQINDEAIALYRKALDLAPGNPGLNNALAQIYLRQRRFESAVDLLRAALKAMPAKTPDEPYLRKTYATALTYIHQDDLAERELDTAMELKPNYAEAMLDKALCHINRNEWKEARALIYSALKLQPENPEAHNKLAILYFNQREFRDALIAIDFAVKYAKPNSGDKAGYLLTKGQVLRKLKRPSDAIAAYSEAIKINPRSIQGLALTGEVLHDLDRDQTAQLYFRSAMGIDPENADVAGRLAELFAFSKDDKCRDIVIAIEYGERAVKLSRESHIPLLRLLAQIYAEAHRFQDAIKTVEKAETVGLNLGFQTQVDQLRLVKQDYYRGLGQFPDPPTPAELKAMQTAPETAPATTTAPDTQPLVPFGPLPPFPM